MKKLYGIIIILFSIFAITPTTAQISIDEVNTKAIFQDTIKPAEIRPEYFSLARYKAERAAIRKERNFIEFGGGLNGTLTSYSQSWIETSGGDNSIALMATLFLHHTFTKNKFFIETKVDAKFGYNRMKVETAVADGQTESTGVWFKNQDEFAFSVAPAFKMSKNWSYGTIIKFRSQFVNGYISRTQQEETSRKSTFMAPGYLDVSLGLTYKSPKPKFPIVINLSPLALSAVFVESEVVRHNVWDDKMGWQAYGLPDANSTSKYEGGSSIQIDFDRTFGKKGVLRYRTTLFSFFGWLSNTTLKNKVSNFKDYQIALQQWKDNGEQGIKPNLPIHPTVRWENIIDIKATKYLTTTFNFQLYYNRAQNYNVQTQTLLSVGLIYTFKNK